MVLVTQAVITFVPGCKSPATSAEEGNFQFPWARGGLPTSRPLMATAAPLNAQTASVAAAGWRFKVNEC